MVNLGRARLGCRVQVALVAFRFPARCNQCVALAVAQRVIMQPGRGETGGGERTLDIAGQGRSSQRRHKARRSGLPRLTRRFAIKWRSTNCCIGGAQLRGSIRTQSRTATRRRPRAPARSPGRRTWRGRSICSSLPAAPATARWAYNAFCPHGAPAFVAFCLRMVSCFPACRMKMRVHRVGCFPPPSLFLLDFYVILGELGRTLPALFDLLRDSH